MLKSTLIIVFILVHSLETFSQKKLVNRELKEIEWKYDKRYSLLSPNEYFAYSLSVADVIDPNGQFQKLDKCTCRMVGDTVEVWIRNNLSEGGVAVSIKITNDLWIPTIQHYSDIKEFESGYAINYPFEKYKIVLNQANYMVGDKLIGSIDITAKNLDILKIEELTLKGKFQCVIMK